MPDPLAGLEEVYAYLQSLPLYPRAIWFIDREADYYRLFRYFSTITGPKPWQADPTTYTSPGLFGMPIYNWRSEDIAASIEKTLQGGDGEYTDLCIRLLKEGRLFPFREPGIWVEMSDGNHRQLTIDQLTTPD